MLNKKTQYAFQALMYLAENQDKGPVLIAEIAAAKKIPLKFLENILLELRSIAGAILTYKELVTNFLKLKLIEKLL